MVALALNIAAFLFIIIVGGYALMLVLTGLFMLCLWIGDLTDFLNAKLNALGDRILKRNHKA